MRILNAWEVDHKLLHEVPSCRRTTVSLTGVWTECLLCRKGLVAGTMLRRNPGVEKRLTRIYQILLIWGKRRKRLPPTWLRKVWFIWESIQKDMNSGRWSTISIFSLEFFVVYLICRRNVHVIVRDTMVEGSPKYNASATQNPCIKSELHILGIVKRFALWNSLPSLNQWNCSWWQRVQILLFPFELLRFTNTCVS